MKWLARLKKQIGPDVEPTKPTKPLFSAMEGGFVGFVGPVLAPIQKTGGDPAAANDSDPDPDRWCWPHSTAMNGQEIDTFTARLARFTDKGLDLDAGERLADRLVIRDREQDTRRLCLECNHLGGTGRCGNWQRAGVAIRSRDAQLPGDLVQLLQHCAGFSEHCAHRESVINSSTISTS